MNAPTEKKAPLSERIQEAVDNAYVTKATAKAYGLEPEDIEGATGKTKEEAPSIVNTALTQMRGMIDDANKMAQEKEKEVRESRKEADDARASLFSTQLTMIDQLTKNLIASQDEMKKNNSPEAALQTVQAYKRIMEEFRPAVSSEPRAPAVSGPSDQVTVQLEQMRQQHEINMKQLDHQMEQSRQQFELQMMQFKEETDRLYREYESKAKLQGDALGGLTDLAAALSGSVDKARGVESDDGGTIQISTKAFPCQSCGNQVKITPGAGSATCPGCGAEYDIKGA